MASWAVRVIRVVISVSGVIALIMMLLAFTRIPFDAHRSLALSQGTCDAEVDMIVILGGSGMPSGPELLRLHHGALAALDAPGATVVVVHPLDSVVMQEMIHELVVKGVEPDRIHALYEGTNTREQALLVSEAFSNGLSANVAVISAPENMYRTVRAFRKVGFVHTCGIPAFDHAMFVDLRYDHQKLGGRRAVPDVSGNLDLRYNFWNYLKLEITCLRECAAIAYYKVNGWI